MKTPTLESIEKKYRNAKEVKEKFTNVLFKIGKNKIYKSNFGNYCVDIDNTIRYLWSKDDNYKGYAEIISYIDPTTKVRNSVLLQLADNNSFSEEILKKECPKLFESEIEINNYYWVKHDNFQNALVFIQGKEVKHTYGFSHYFEFTDMYRNDLLHGTYKKDIIRKATPKEVETAFKDLFIKMGFVNGVRVLRNWRVTKEVEIVEGKIMYHSHSNAITISGREIFKDGKFAEIIETPTDIITIVEKYGKDKVISLIEKM